MSGDTLCDNLAGNYVAFRVLWVEVALLGRESATFVSFGFFCLSVSDGTPIGVHLVEGVYVSVWAGFRLDESSRGRSANWY